MNEELLVFKNHILQYVDYKSEAEIDEILSSFSLKKYSKGDFFKEQNKAIKEVGFLINGSMRRYIHNKNGDDITLQIIDRPTYITDLHSLKSGESNTFILECLEDCTILVVSLEKIQKLSDENLTLNIFIRKVMIESLIPMIDSQILFLTGSAKDRYQWILENNPSLVQKFPIRFIASLIGITPTQMSRIRKQK